MSSVSDKSESVKERSHTDQQKIKFRISKVCRKSDELIRQSANDVAVLGLQHNVIISWLCDSWKFDTTYN